MTRHRLDGKMKGTGENYDTVTRTREGVEKKKWNGEPPGDTRNEVLTTEPMKAVSY